MVQCLLCKYALMEWVLPAVKTSGRSPGPSPFACSLGENENCSDTKGWDPVDCLLKHVLPVIIWKHTLAYLHTHCAKTQLALWSCRGHLRLSFFLSVTARLQSWWCFPFGPSKNCRSRLEWFALCCTPNKCICVLGEGGFVACWSRLHRLLANFTLGQLFIKGNKKYKFYSVVSLSFHFWWWHDTN